MFAEHLNSQRQRELAMSVIDAAAEGLIVTDLTGQIIMVNAAFSRITGYEAVDVLGQNPRILKSGRHDQVFYEQMWLALIQDGFWEGQIWNKNKDGMIYPEWVSIRTVRDEKGQAQLYVAMFFDRTEYEALESRLRYLSDYDVLTGLPNRGYFLNRLALAIAHVKRRRQHLAICVVNLRQFRAINDALGHHEGDRLLKEMAQRIQKELPLDDLVTRLDGAEFALLLFETAGERDIVEVVDSIINEIEKPWSYKDTEFQITARVGIAVFPQDGEDGETLLKNATVVVQRETEDSQAHYQFYAADINDQIREKFLWVQRLRLAVQRQEFVLHYQPQVDVLSRRMIGVEALVRWQHPELGLISPLGFIPLAEETGLILPIGEWVLRTACQQNKVWQEAGYPPIRVAVNLSALQFRQPDLAQKISQVLHETGLEARWLELETTESVAMQDVHFTLPILEELRAMGVGLSLDDFGTGYSSLSYLKRFPIRTVKVDKSFVKEIPNSPEDSAIVSMIIALAKCLKLRVIAEGVETVAQLSFLEELECEEAQGYLLSRPVPADAITEMFLKPMRDIVP